MSRKTCRWRTPRRDASVTAPTAEPPREVTCRTRQGRRSDDHDDRKGRRHLLPARHRSAAAGNPRNPAAPEGHRAGHPHPDDEGLRSRPQARRHALQLPAGRVLPRQSRARPASSAKRAARTAARRSAISSRSRSRSSSRRFRKPSCRRRRRTAWRRSACGNCSPACSRA